MKSGRTEDNLGLPGPGRRVVPAVVGQTGRLPATLARPLLTEVRLVRVLPPPGLPLSLPLPGHGQVGLPRCPAPVQGEGSVLTDLPARSGGRGVFGGPGRGDENVVLGLPSLQP